MSKPFKQLLNYFTTADSHDLEQRLLEIQQELKTAKNSKLLLAELLFIQGCLLFKSDRKDSDEEEN